MHVRVAEGTGMQTGPTHKTLPGVSIVAPEVVQAPPATPEPDAAADVTCWTACAPTLEVCDEAADEVAACVCVWSVDETNIEDEDPASAAISCDTASSPEYAPSDEFNKDVPRVDDRDTSDERVGVHDTKFWSTAFDT